MIYLAEIILLALAVWSLQDLIIKIITLTSGIECAAEIERFQEYRTRSMSMSGSDKIQYRAVLKYIDIYGKEHKVISPKLYEQWEKECLLGRTETIRYYRQNPEKIIMDKKEIVRPVIILALVLLLPVLYVLVSRYLLYRFFRTL